MLGLLPFDDGEDVFDFDFAEGEVLFLSGFLLSSFSFELEVFDSLLTLVLRAARWIARFPSFVYRVAADGFFSSSIFMT